MKQSYVKSKISECNQKDWNKWITVKLKTIKLLRQKQKQTDRKDNPFFTLYKRTRKE